MSIAKGYKQTEVGVIPEDWEVKRIIDISLLKSGLSITANEISEIGGYSCYGGNGLRGFTKKFTHNGKYPIIGRQAWRMPDYGILDINLGYGLILKKVCSKDK